MIVVLVSCKGAVLSHENQGPCHLPLENGSLSKVLYYVALYCVVFLLVRRLPYFEIIIMVADMPRFSCLIQRWTLANHQTYNYSTWSSNCPSLVVLILKFLVGWAFAVAEMKHWNSSCICLICRVSCIILVSMIDFTFSVGWSSLGCIYLSSNGPGYWPNHDLIWVCHQLMLCIRHWFCRSFVKIS